MKYLSVSVHTHILEYWTVVVCVLFYEVKRGKEGQWRNSAFGNLTMLEERVLGLSVTNSHRAVGRFCKNYCSIS